MHPVCVLTLTWMSFFQSPTFKYPPKVCVCAHIVATRHAQFCRSTASIDVIELTDSDVEYRDYYPLLYSGTSDEEDPCLSSPNEQVVFISRVPHVYSHPSRTMLSSMGTQLLSTLNPTPWKRRRPTSVQTRSMP